MSIKKIRILVISNTPWHNDNSFGNSYTSIFKGIEHFEFANIYCNYGVPDNNMVSHSFQITEKSLLKNLIQSNYPTGRVVDSNEKITSLNKKQTGLFNYFKKNRLQLFFWIRDLIWKIGRWKSLELKQFISDFQPDLIFQPLYYSTYINDLVLYAKELTKVPMVAYVSDDIYTLKQFSLSPFYWIDRLYKRKKIKKVVNLCEHFYVISEKQKNEYEKAFNKSCKILTKGADFSEPNYKKKYNKPFKFTYTGNISGGRWKSLAMIGRALHKINKESDKARLIIYTATPMSVRMRKALTIPDSIYLKGFVPSKEIPQILSDSDVLVHVEPLDLKGRLLVRHSFSTKIVDYLHTGRTIFAIGSTKVASIDSLNRNHAALIATNQQEVYDNILKLIKDPNLLNYYSQKSWNYGQRDFQLKNIQDKLYHEILSLL